MAIKVCEVCRKEYKVNGSRAEKSRTCSRECFAIIRDKRITKKCSICGKEYKVQGKKAEQSVACSRGCLGKWNGKQRYARVKKECVVCGKEYEAKRSKSPTSSFCSLKCHGKWQSEFMVGENSPTWKDRIIKKCVICGREFTVKPYRDETAKCCSRKCLGQYATKFNHSVEADRKRKLLAQTSEKREIKRQIMLQTLTIYPRETSIEKAIREWLEVNEVSHIAQHVIGDKFCVDFYLPEHNVIIEALGDYFHANPAIYGENKTPLNEMQVKNSKKDKSRFAYLRKCGYSVYGFWECDIKKDLNSLMQGITELVNTGT